MSNSHDSETRRAALDKVQEGHRLLTVRDYEGAIMACTEAIELDPSSAGAYRTRANAYRRLGVSNKASCDLFAITKYGFSP